MDVDFVQLKHVDQRTKDLVFGYIKRNTQCIDEDVVPSLVTHLCLAFYWFREYFAQTGPTVDLSDDRLTISLPSMRDHDCRYGPVSFGAVIIPSVNNDLIHKWTLQITKYAVNYSLLLGVAVNWENTTDAADATCYNAYSGSIFSSTGMDASWTPYGPSCAQGDIVEIELDLKNRRMIFHRNGKNIGVAKTSLKKDHDTEYRLCVVLNGDSDSVTILDFQQYSHRKKG